MKKKNRFRLIVFSLEGVLRCGKLIIIEKTYIELLNYSCKLLYYCCMFRYLGRFSRQVVIKNNRTNRNVKDIFTYKL